MAVKTGGKKQGEHTGPIGTSAVPEFKGPGVEGSKTGKAPVRFILTNRDGGPKRVYFDEDGKETHVLQA